MSEERFGPYRLEGLIGRGGMGEVYRAFDTVKKRAVAIKRLPAPLVTDAEFQARFRRESELAARLIDPHVIPIYNYGQIDGQLFIEMRLVEGTDLAGLLASTGPLPPDRAVEIVSQVAGALDSAHNVGLIHRDVKPSNVLITRRDNGEEFVYLSDFGVARALAGATSLTMTGATVGTLAYMAPERFTGQSDDHRIDVYALACLLYECLTARPPFTGEGLPALMYAHLNTQPPKPSEQQPGIPTDLDAVVAHGMAKQPKHRHPTASALAAAAGTALTDTSTTSPNPANDLHDKTFRSTAIPPYTPSMTVPPSGPDDEGPAANAIRDPGSLRRAEHSALDSPSDPGRPATGAPTFVPRVGGTAATHIIPSAQQAGWQHQRRRILFGVAATVVFALVGMAMVLIQRHAAPSSAAGSSPPVLSLPRTPTSTRPGPPNTVIDTIALDGYPLGIAVSPDGKRAYVGVEPRTGTSGEQTLQIIDTATDTVVARVRGIGDTPYRLAVTPDGQRVYVTLPNREAIAVIDTTSNSVSQLTTRFVGVLDIAIDKNGDHAFLTGNPVSVLELKSNTVAESITTSHQSGSFLAVSPDGRRLVVPHDDSAVASVIDRSTNSVTDVPVASAVFHFVAITPSGRYAYVTNGPGTSGKGGPGSISVIDLTTNTNIATIPVAGTPDDIAISPDGRFAYIANHEADAVQVIDTTTNSLVGTIANPGNPLWLAISPNGHRLYVTSAADNVTAHDLS